MGQTIFISYSRADSAFVKRLIDDLTKQGLSVWLDQRDIPAGQRWDRVVEQALQQCETFVVVLSPNSVASENVLDEISYAISARKRIIPILLKDCEVPFRIARIQYVDFRDAYASALPSLVAEIRKQPRPASIKAKKKKSAAGTVLGILLAGVCLIGLLYGGYWVYENFLKKTSSPGSIPAATVPPAPENPFGPETVADPTEINPNLAPTGEYLTLDAWFLNDPQLAFVQGGGPVGLSYLNDMRTGNPCNGSASEAPNAVVNMTGSSDGLGFWYKTGDSAMAALLVMMPSGATFCPGASNVSTWRFESAPPGEYKLWIGTFGNDAQNGTLYVSYNEWLNP